MAEFTSNSCVVQSFDWVCVPPLCLSQLTRRIHHAFPHCDAASNYIQPINFAQKCGMFNSLHAFARIKCQFFILCLLYHKNNISALFK